MREPTAKDREMVATYYDSEGVVFLVAQVRETLLKDFEALAIEYDGDSSHPNVAGDIRRVIERWRKQP